MSTREERPRRTTQLLAWAIVAVVFCGLAWLVDAGTRSTASTPPFVPASVAAPPVAAAGHYSATAAVPPDTGRDAEPTVRPVLSAFRLAAAPVDDTTDRAESCNKDEQRTALPIHRWGDFSLDVVDNAMIFKTRLFMSMIAGLGFILASLLWKVLAVFLGFSLGFDMVCTAATPINTAAKTVSVYMAFFIVPAFLVVLFAAMRRWRNPNQGPAMAIRMLTVFAFAAGGVFFVSDQTAKHQSDPLAAYTPPWMAREVQQHLDGVATSLNKLGELTGDAGITTWAFYDTNAKVAGNAPCYKLDKALYDQYGEDNAGTIGGTQATSMEQLSRIWELAFVRSWEVAQFGNGNPNDPYPSMVACRLLEMRSDVGADNKAKAFDRGAPDAGPTKKDSNRYRVIDYLPDDEQKRKQVFLWAACGLEGNKFTTVGEWKFAKGGDSGDHEDLEKQCNDNLSADKSDDTSDLVGGTDDDGELWFNGGDEVDHAFEDCTDDHKCPNARDFADSYMGANSGDRLLQSLMAAITAIIFMFALGPLAIGLMILQVALALLVMMLGVTLILLALGKESGKRLLKLTGTAAAGKFLFTLAITAMATFIYISFDAIDAAIGRNSDPSLLEQVLMAGAPILALVISRRIFKTLGLGDIASLSGSLGFMSAATLKATGDQTLSRHADRRVASRVGRLGVGNKRISNFDERTLGRRMIDNRLTRGAARKAGRTAGRAMEPAARRAREFAANQRARVGALREAVNSTDPKKRAAAYAALAGLGALDAGVSGGALFGMPAMVAGAKAFHRRRMLKSGGDVAGAMEAGAYDPGSAAGWVTSSTSATEAENAALMRQRMLSKIGDADERRSLHTGHLDETLIRTRARQHGAASAGGFNRDFGGFAHAGEEAAALRRFSEISGIPVSGLITGSHGLIVPDPKIGGVHGIPSNAPLHMLGNGAFWLDAATRERRRMPDGSLETDAQRAARFVVQLHERGYVDDGGHFVDVLKAHNLDVDDPVTRRRVEAFASGAADPELSRMVIRAPSHGETQSIWFADQWANRETPDSARIEALYDGVHHDALTNARREISDFRSAPVIHPSGGQATVDNVYREVNLKLAELGNLLGRSANFDRWANQSGGSSTMSQAEIGQQQEEYASRHRALAGELDQLVGVLQNSFDSASAARRFYATDMAASAHIQDAGQDLEPRLRELHDKLDRFGEGMSDDLVRLLGAVSVAPDNPAAGRSLARSIEDLRSELSQRFSEQERFNAELRAEMASRDAQAEQQRAAHAMNPRVSHAWRPRTSHSMLDEQRDLF